MFEPCGSVSYHLHVDMDFMWHYNMAIIRVSLVTWSDHLHIADNSMHVNWFLIVSLTQSKYKNTSLVTYIRVWHLTFRKAINAYY